MKRIYPSYYKEFSCIAGACPDSCCHEWDVQVDQASAARFAALEGPLGERLRESMYTEDGEVYLRNVADRCPMWRADGLCDIQAALGHDALCRVCQQFPRLTQDYGSFVELGLEMSCPEAARIMLETEHWHLVTEEADGGEEPDYDPEIMESLEKTRPFAIEMLTSTAYSVPERLAQLLIYGYHIQSEIDLGEDAPFDPAAALATAREAAGSGDLEAFRGFWLGLEMLTQRWREKLEGLKSPEWDDRIARLAQYGVYRYWYQAVSDWDLVGRVKLVVSGCILAAMLPGERVESIQLFSKEIENSAENIDAVLDGVYGEAALTDRNLLGLLHL